MFDAVSKRVSKDSVNTNEVKALSELLNPGDTLMLATKSGALASSRPLTFAKVEDN